MKKLVRLSATPALVAGMTAALTPGAADAQSLFDELNFYVGATGGILSGDADFELDTPFGNESQSTEADLGIFSAIAGIDLRTEDGWLFGIEGDIGLPAGDYPNDDNINAEDMKWSDFNYNAHLRARAGARFGRADVFVAIGLAVAEFEQEYDDGTNDDFTLTGLSLGAGVDWFFTDSLAARIEVIRDDYGRKDTRSFPNTDYSGDWTDTTVRGGLLFQF